LDFHDLTVTGEEPEIGEGLREAFEEEGIAVHTPTEAVQVESGDGGVRVPVRGNDDEIWIDASHLLIAAGRVPNTDALGLEAAGGVHGPAS